MSRLNLDAFKVLQSDETTQELENLSGGILGACHCAPEDDYHGPGCNGNHCYPGQGDNLN